MLRTVRGKKLMILYAQFAVNKDNEDFDIKAREPPDKTGFLQLQLMFLIIFDPIRYFLDSRAFKCLQTKINRKISRKHSSKWENTALTGLLLIFYITHLKKPNFIDFLTIDSVKYEKFKHHLVFCFRINQFQVFYHQLIVSWVKSSSKEGKPDLQPIFSHFLTREILISY